MSPVEFLPELMLSRTIPEGANVVVVLVLVELDVVVELVDVL